METFKVPDPIPWETHDQYLLRVVAAIEEWVNKHYRQALLASIQPLPSLA